MRERGNGIPSERPFAIVIGLLLAMLVASAIAEKDDRYRLFAPFGLTPTGGAIGVGAAQLSYWTFELRDALRGVSNALRRPFRA